MNNVRSASLPSAQNITRVPFENGITVLVYENFAAQSVVVSGALRVGSLYESPEHNGLASLTTAGLMRGTERRDFDSLHAALEDIGADFGYSSGIHRSNLYGKALAEDLPTLADILADTLRHATFPDAEMERLRGEFITGLTIRQQDTRYRARRAFYETLYPAGHPYHYSTRGTLQTLPALTVEQTREFHRQNFGPDGMILVVVGAVQAQDAVEILQDRLADWRNPQQPAERHLPTLTPPAATQRTDVYIAGKTQSDLVIGRPGPARTDPDYQAAQLANSVLGQFGMMGRVGASVREELGLAYYAYSQLEGGLGRAPWSLTAGVNPANIELAIERIVDEIRRLTREPVSEEDLSDNQSYFVGHLPLQLESNEGIASSILNIETYGLGLDYLLHYRDTIMRLTRDDLLEAAQRYLDPNALVIAVAGPAQTSESIDG